MPYFLRLIALNILIILNVSYHAVASPPIPQSKSDILQSYQNQISEEKKKKNDLEKKASDLNNDLKLTKRNLIAIARDVQQNQDNIEKYEQRIENLKNKEISLRQKLQKDRSSLSNLFIALQRIRKTPPEAMLARPEAPYKTAQSALVMQRIIPAINRHAATVKDNLETLHTITKDIEGQHRKLLDAATVLRKKEVELSRLLDKRKSLYEKTNKDIKVQEISIQKISLQAQDLSDLVKRIKKHEEEEHKRRQRNLLEQKKEEEKRIAQNAALQSSDRYLPISGILKTGYNTKDELGSRSKGITFEGRQGAMVIAPMGGKIQFTGAFKRYGNIIIIEHYKNYHSLLSGLDQINVSVGQLVEAGEPIGTLSNSALIPRPTLYYELRKAGNPVNPSVKFPDLG